MTMTRRAFAVTAGVALGSLLAGCSNTTQDKSIEPTPPPVPEKDSGQNAGQANGQEQKADAQDKKQAKKATGIEVFDMHGDTIGPLGLADYEPYRSESHHSGTLVKNDCEVSAKHIGKMRWAQCYAIWTPDDCPSTSYRNFYETGAKWFKRQMKKYPERFTQVLDFRDIPEILDEGKVAAILTVENAVALEEGLEVVDEYAKDGVKIAGITWNGANVLGSGHLTSSGLTKLGRKYVASLEEHDIVVDVSHLNDAGFWDVADIATRPFIATHSNSRAVCGVPRNLTDKQFKVFVERGGLVGWNFHKGFVQAGGGSYDFDALVAHIEHWLDLGGEDVIALGADRDGSSIPSWLADCSKQKDLFKLTSKRIGKKLAKKLFYENAQAFFSKYEAESKG